MKFSIRCLKCLLEIRSLLSMEIENANLNRRELSGGFLLGIRIFRKFVLYGIDGFFKG